MLTKNYHAYMMMRAVNRYIPDCLMTLDGSVDSAYPMSSTTSEDLFRSIHKLTLKTANTSGGVIIGTGTTPATPGDYKLEAMITGGVDITAPSNATMVADDNGVSIFASYAITNQTDEDIAISEIGIFGSLCKNSSNQTAKALLDRTVLEMPITIAPGDAKTLTYTIRMNYPTA